LKNQEPFKSKLLFLYNGEVVDKDALGNILYGYLGKCYRIPDNILYLGAGYAQIKAKTQKFSWVTNYFDDPRDTARIKQGIQAYVELHKKVL
jgi:hypothetical protein